MSDQTAGYARLIEDAKKNRPDAVSCLRELLREFADDMPLGVLIHVSEAVLEARRKEIRKISEAN